MNFPDPVNEVGLCLGCKAFALLMRVGAIHPGACERCNGLAAAQQ